MTEKIWNAKTVKQLTELRQKRLEVKEIARIMQLKKTQVSGALQRYRITMIPEEVGEWTEEEIAQLKQMAAEGVSKMKAARELGIKLMYVKAKVLELGLRMKEVDKKYTYTSKPSPEQEEDQKFLNAIRFTKDVRKLQKLMGNVNSYAIKKLCKKHRINDDTLTNCWWKETATGLASVKDDRRF